MRGRDLTGRSFGRLTVLARGESTQRSEARWTCQCVCGRETLVYGKALLSGNTRSCGCLRLESLHDLAGRPKQAARDLTGLAIGRLTVIERVIVRGDSLARGRGRWRCHCRCGQEVMVRGGALLSGNTQSCGCLRSERARVQVEINRARKVRDSTKDPVPTDMTGLVFGRLTVVALEAKIRGKISWRCRCRCGNEHVTSRASLISGNTRSCGCLRSRWRGPALNRKVIPAPTSAGGASEDPGIHGNRSAQ